MKRFAALLLSLAASAGFAAESAQFDLVGPSLRGTVTRGDATLPLTQVPNFAAGDRITMKAELPINQSAAYLMVAAFLRGPTNPPPDDWFFRCKTWVKACTEKGLTITVPAGAQQLLVFFAPKTGGDFKTLRGAVQGKPGAFVRAAQQLNQSALDRSRVDLYIADVRERSLTNPAALKDEAPLLARSLAIKVDEKCLDRIPALQLPCLTQSHDALILNDGSQTSMAATLTSGPASDLAIQAASTPKLDSGAYIPYIGSFFDIARLMDNFHTAHYQYIPALNATQGDRLMLMLNTPPSFHDPQSVLVAALPPIEAAQRPALHAVDAAKAYCVYQSPLVLAVEGAPLVFSTGYSRDLALQVAGADGQTMLLPARADARQGGLVIDGAALGALDVDTARAATVRGSWGFDAYEGPSFRLVKPQGRPWALASGEETTLVAGQESTLHAQGGSASCIESIRLARADADQLDVDWKETRPGLIEMQLPLRNVDPGPVTLEIRQYGVAQPQQIALRAFAGSARLDGFTLYAGDAIGTLKGAGLDQVASLELKGYGFTPGVPQAGDGGDELPMTANDAQGVAGLKGGENAEARVLMKDGRKTTLKVAIGPQRPRGVLIAKDIKRAAAAGTPIVLADDDELPLDATLTFSVRALAPQTIPRDLQVEVATADGSNSTLLSVANGRLTLESRNVAVANVQPSADFGPSAFGVLQFRLVMRGVGGDWQRLATLTRVPTLSGLRCAPNGEGNCTLSGANLFLIDSIANNAKFRAPVRVAEGFPGYALEVPRPSDGRLYIRLRDNPGVINTATFDVAAPVVTPAAPAGSVAPEPTLPSTPPASTPVVPAPAAAPTSVSAPAPAS
ncbi:MAG: hypothetical protein QM718_11960 [Steroidobacteraceae bacterium]